MCALPLLAAELKRHGLHVDMTSMGRGEKGTCRVAKAFLLNTNLHWLALCQNEFTGCWELHDAGEVDSIDDHEVYLKQFVAESEDNWAIPLRQAPSTFCLVHVALHVLCLPPCP